MSFFKVKTYASEFLSALEPGFKGTALSQSDVEPDELPAMTDFKEMTKDFIINDILKHFQEVSFGVVLSGWSTSRMLLLVVWEFWLLRHYCQQPS